MREHDIGAGKKTANGAGARGGSTKFSRKSYVHGLIPWPLAVADVA